MKQYKAIFIQTCVCITILIGVLSCTKKDSEPPFIDVKGAIDTTIFINASYYDPGAKAKDNFDDDVAVVTEIRVNTSKVGVYYVIYSAEDRAGNVATAQRTVRVYNSANSFAGTYMVSKNCGFGETIHTEIVTASDVTNNKLTLANFFDNSSLFVDAYLRADSTITFATQIVKATSDGDTITLTNTNAFGQSRQLPDRRLLFQISEYVKSDTGSIRGVPGTKYTLNCTCMYTKQ